MFSSDQLALIFAALVIVGLTLAGMLAVVLAAGRRSRAARAAATRPRGTPADFSLPPEARATFAPATPDAQAIHLGYAVAPAAQPPAAQPPAAPPPAYADSTAYSAAGPTAYAGPAAHGAAPAAYGAAPAPPPGPASSPMPAQYPAGLAPAAPSSFFASAAPEAHVFDQTVPQPAGPGQAPTEGSRAATPPPEVERERRFTFDTRAHDPRADDAIAGYLGLDPAGRRDMGPPLDPFVDPATGLETLLAWERLLAEEGHRYARYKRPVSVVVAELDGLARLVDRVGAEAARRVLPAVGDALRRHARRTDHVAHAGGGRFLMLLPETDEIQAINYVERVRVACERWLEAGAVALRLSIGWASPTAVGGLEGAVRTAEDRMYGERRRGGPPGEPPDRRS